MPRFFRVLLLSFALAPSIRAAYNADEHFALVDCGIGSNPDHPEWATSFHAWYFTGEIWKDAAESDLISLPSQAANVDAGGSYPWRESGVSFTMSNGDAVSVTIHPNVNDPNHAGSMTHSYDDHPLACWSYHKALRTTCKVAYVCNHKDGPHPAARDKVSVAISTTKDFAKFKGNIDPAEVFKSVSYGDNGKCDESWKDAPGGCKIKYRCHGNKKQTTPAMVDALKKIGKDYKDLVKHDTETERIWDPCKTGRDTCVGGWVDGPKTDITWIPQTLSIDVADAEGDDQGSLDYEIDCSSGPQCDVCNNMKAGAGLISMLAGVFGPAFGIPAQIMDQTIKFSCLAQGC
jgi:hypothetical protein